MTLDAAWARRWVAGAANALASAKDDLTELDRQIGDGDHGVNMDRGFRAVVVKLDETPADDDETVGAVLKLVATTLMSTVGGAAGPLYGTAFMRASKVTGRTELDAPAVVALLEAAEVADVAADADVIRELAGQAAANVEAKIVRRQIVEQSLSTADVGADQAEAG